ncbi:TerB family tellurite resistance protein [Hydrogenophaga sp.]|uniref:tellurite resistance TerB family protein n=1 Tax=Hydrogenophaga sp. TaxID=1904254 RepID=UPI002627CD0E|nr:TerB family tellurite resistance protein [Hydrogenophaga sp.]MDM7951443.1 TerB family tellurite resistance protein [Hydrogenophaga sp.]
MQSFEINSPQAAAQVVALALVADGEIGHDELALLDSMNVHEQLDLARDEMFDVMRDFCREALSSPPSAWSHDCPLDEREVTQLMAQITQPVLRQRVLQICVQIAEADGEVADGESLVLNAVVEHWGLQRQMLRPMNDWPMARAA